MNDLFQARKLIKECLNKQTTCLDLGNCGISNLGELPELFKCTQLETLILSSNWYDYAQEKYVNSKNKGDPNNVEYITQDITRLKNLQNLKMGSVFFLFEKDKSQTKDISFLKELTALQSLDLRDNQISDISFLKELTALQSLDLRDNQISDISFLKELTALQSLDLEDNQISDISFLKELTALQSLDLSDNQISDISFLKELTALQSLDLSDNQISDISFLKELTALQSLDLRGNQISDINFLKDLTALQSLVLSYNQISDISFLKDLTALQSLDLGANQISDISFLKELTALQSLDLEDNQISDISFLKELTALLYLNLRHNLISDISFLKELTALQSLDLSYNLISDISFLKELTTLQSLDLRYNQISDISFLNELTALQSLDLHNNQISDISFLKDLTTLQSLDLSLNQISDISFLKDLTALQSLDLSYNQISELPIWISDFSMEIEMREFGDGVCLYGNPLQKPNVEIVKQGKEAIKRYFEELERKDVEELQLLEAKVLLLGEGKTGKTSLRFKLEDEDKPLPKDDERTRGIDIYHHTFPVKNDTFISHIWDFGGQDVLYQVHRFFLSDDALYILVTDSRADQGNKFEEWLQNIEIFTNNQNKQIILLQNLKHGDTPANIDIAEYKKYYTIADGKVFEVDLSFSEDKHLGKFRKFRDVIEHRLLELPHVQKPILSHWLAVRKELEKRLKNKTYLIKLSEYSKICRENKVNNTESQKDLLRYLHGLGIVLWYEKYSAVKQKVILNPEWITSALYLIIDSKNIRDKNGKLEQEDIEKLWNQEIYEDYHNELLEILKIFRLAYKRKQEDAYIVPSLMNTSVPERYEKWNQTGKWIIKYSYPRLMPRGIVNQLAAELCRYIESDFNDVWAFGVVFTAKNARAKVQESRNIKKIEVEAYGDERLVLMQNIVKALEDIHSTYKGLEYEIEIPCTCEKCKESTNADKTYYDYYKGIMREINDNRDDIYCRNLRRLIKIAPILRSSGFALPYKLAEMLGEKEKGYKTRKDSIEKSLKDIEITSKGILRNTEEIKLTLDIHFEYLLHLNENSKLNKEKIINAVKANSRREKRSCV